MSEENLKHPQNEEPQNESDLDKLRRYILKKIDDKTLTTSDIVAIAKTSGDAANLVKQFTNSHCPIDEVELTTIIATEMLKDFEKTIDNHLSKYQKFTLNSNVTNATTEAMMREESASFFNLISLLRDVSILGRKLLESAPQLNALSCRPSSANHEGAESEPPNEQTNERVEHLEDTTNKFGNFKLMDDATSEDLLAALIESSSTDDFLVLSSSVESISLRDMMLAALIYIKAHECFTLSHDIQGVVMVLRRIKFMIVNILVPRDQMELAIKLLTSIGRYNEMTYVFDLFRDNNKFEILLSKGVDRTPELRIALFNYVKKNPEFYALVTLNFSMFREIAESLEASACKRLDKVILASRLCRDSLTISREGSKVHRRKPSSTSTSAMSNPSSSLKMVSSQPSIIGLVDTTSSTIPHQPSRREVHRKLTTISTTSVPVVPMLLSLPTSVASSKAATDGASAPDSARYESPGMAKRAPNARESLEVSLTELADASDCFTKAGCYRKSETCERRARLVALQLAKLDTTTTVASKPPTAADSGAAAETTTATTTCHGLLSGLSSTSDEQDAPTMLELLDMATPSELTETISNLSSFVEALIVSEAYDYHLAWRWALFKNVIINGNRQYLEDFSARLGVSRTLIQELVILYKRLITYASSQLKDPNGNPGWLATAAQTVLGPTSSNNEFVSSSMWTSSTSGANELATTSYDYATGSNNNKLDEIKTIEKNMRLLVSRLADVELKCKLYGQLRFDDSNEQMMQQNEFVRAHLKDLKLA